MTMTSTRKRKSSSTDDASKKVKTEDELSATVEDNEQQIVEEQQERKTEGDSPPKKLAAANVLVAISDAAGEGNEGVIEDKEKKGMLALKRLIICLGLMSLSLMFVFYVHKNHNM